MRIKYLIVSVVTFAILSSILPACNKDNTVSSTESVALVGKSFVEEFDTIQSAYVRGWRFINTSTPIGKGLWTDGDPNSLLGTAYSNYGTNSGYIMSNDPTICPGTTPPGNGIGSNWLVSPSTVMKNGDVIEFYVKVSDSTMGDRLQLRLNPTDDGLNVGSGVDVGSFTNILLDINPEQNLIPNYYLLPQTNWTKYTATVYGLSKPTQARFALRVFMQYAGPDPMAEWSGSLLGIDRVVYTSK